MKQCNVPECGVISIRATTWTPELHANIPYYFEVTRWANTRVGKCSNVAYASSFTKIPIIWVARKETDALFESLGYGDCDDMVVRNTEDAGCSRAVYTIGILSCLRRAPPLNRNPYTNPQASERQEKFLLQNLNLSEVGFETTPTE